MAQSIRFAKIACVLYAYMYLMNNKRECDNQGFCITEGVCVCVLVGGGGRKNICSI